MASKIATILFIFIFYANVAYSATLIGTGYGKTKDEAKKEALSDLSQSVNVLVYSKHERRVLVDKRNLAQSESSRFTKLISKVAFINPNITYSKEKKLIKAVAIVDNPKDYALKMADLCEKINSLTTFSNNVSDEVIYRSLEKALPIYDEYESYETILHLLDYNDYPKPELSLGATRQKLIDLSTTPPNLEIAAEVLTNDIKSKPNIFVATPVISGTKEITDFSLFFKDVLESKVKAVKNQNIASYTLSCSYGTVAKDIIMNCSLLSGSSMALSSSMVKIPNHLIKGMKSHSSSPNLALLVDEYENKNSSLKVNIKISSSENSTILNAGEKVTLLVKSNKKAYLYFVVYANTFDMQAASLMVIPKTNEYLLNIKEKDINKWLSLGMWKVSDVAGSYSIQVFATENEPDFKSILPEYAQNNFNLLPVNIERASKDLINHFRRHKGDKYVTSLTYNVIGSKK